MISKLTNTKHGEIQMLFEKAVALGWSVDHENDNTFRIGQYSPAGQDFGIEIDTEGDPVRFLDNLLEAYENFDVSEEAYIWLGPDGHGRNGAPYDMKEVYYDMEACEKMLSELYNELNDYYNELCDGKDI